MRPTDSHVHSEWSFDTSAQASMVASCQRAVELGLPAVAFTEHVEFTDWGAGDAFAPGGLTIDWWSKIQPLAVEGYLAAIDECRERFPSLRVLSGIEAGEPHLFAGSVRSVLSAGRFDRVLGSLHAFPWRGELRGARDLLAELPADELMRKYFAEVVRLVEGSDAFEVLAHLDYPRRYWPETAKPYQEIDFEEEYRAVLRALATSGRVLELNTKSPLASVELLRWWRQEGGRAVSVGSDAHLPWLVGLDFDLAADVLDAAGFRPSRVVGDFWRC